MSRKCENCGKKTVFGNKVSHSQRKTRRTWCPNLVRIKTFIQGEIKRAKICTKCLKSGKLKKVV